MIVRADEDALTMAVNALAAHYGRYGYRRITELLKKAGWRVGTDRVQRWEEITWNLQKRNRCPVETVSLPSEMYSTMWSSAVSA